MAELFLLHSRSDITSNPLGYESPGEQQVFNTLLQETPAQSKTDDNNTPILEFCWRSIIEPPDLETQGEKGVGLGELVILPAIKAMTAATSNALSDYVAYKHQSAAIPVFEALVKLHAIDFRPKWVHEAVEIII